MTYVKSVNPVGQFVLVLSLGLLSFIILGDPVDKFSMDYADWRNETEPDNGKWFYRMHVQSLIPTRVHISHFSRLFQKPQTSVGLCGLMHSASSADEDAKHPCSENKHTWFKSNTYKYITDEVFKNAQDSFVAKDKPESEIMSSLDTNISPLHKAMLLSGCYGNYHHIRHSYSALNVLDAKWFRNVVHNENTSFVMNIMLQHLENTESLTSTRAPSPQHDQPLNQRAYKVSRDRSVCACMKDYATPYFIKEHPDGNIDDPTATDSYDTCLAQNVQDSTFNAPSVLPFNNGFKDAYDGGTWDASYSEARYSVTFAKRMEGESPVLRNRKDPVSHLIETYFNEIADANADDPADTAQTTRDTKLNNLMMHKANIKGYNPDYFKNLVNTLITSTVWDHNTTTHSDVNSDLMTYLPGFTEIQTLPLNVPFATIRPNNFENSPSFNVPEAVNWGSKTVPLQDLREFRLTYTSYMYAHNKHVSPNINIKKDVKIANTPAHLRSTAAENPPRLTQSEYQMYTKKYLSMFKMCSEQAVGSYSLDATQRTNTRLFVQMAEALHLYAVWYGVLSYLYEKWKVRSTLAPNSSLGSKNPTCGANIISGSITVLMLIALVPIMIKLLHFFVEYGKGFKRDGVTDFNNHQGISNAGSFLMGLNVCTLVIIFLSVLYACMMWFQIFAPTYSCCFRRSFALERLQRELKKQNPTNPKESTALQRARVLHDDYEVEFAVAKQVIFDVSIIIGITNYAVAFQMQRGIVWNVVLVSSILLFLTLGFLQHMSNLTRILQHIANILIKEKQGEGDRNVQFFAYNRSIVVAFVALGMLLYMHMASLSYGSWNGVVLFGNVHSWIFVAIAFFVFCGFDIGYEFFYQMKKERDVKTPQFVVNKMVMTGIIIMLGIFVLRLHEYTGFCSSLYGGYNDHDPHTYGMDESIALDNEDLRLTEMCDRTQFWFAFAHDYEGSVPID